MVSRPHWIAAIAAIAATSAFAASRETPAASRYDAAIEKLSHAHGVPERLIRRIIMRESRYAPHLVHHGNYGLMQIKLQTAKGMGFRGTPAQLLDGETNLTYAVPYLANAWLLAGRDEDRAVQLYAGGYYYVARRKGLLPKLRTAQSSPVMQTPTVAYAESVQAPPPASPFAFLFGDGSPAAQPAAAVAAAPAEPAPAVAEEQAAPIAFVEAPLPPRRPRGL